jgi:phosphopentomutase
MTSLDYRNTGKPEQHEKIQEFWARWQDHYGKSGFVNPRGDRLLTELTLWSLQHLQPRLLMVNYNDPDYVHWGNMSHYTRGISVIDQGLKQLVSAVDADPFYRDNTIFVVVPDCGRDSNPLVKVPCQHHFNSKSAHQIWALVFGPGVPKNTMVDREVQQTSLAATIGRYMTMPAEHTEAPALEEAIA